MRAAIVGVSAFLAAVALAGGGAHAGRTCGHDDYWCSKQCGAWNNWCRPACGDWNAWCAGQSLPDILSRMSPQSYFANPTWHGFQSDQPRASETPAPKVKRRAKAKTGRTTKQADR